MKFTDYFEFSPTDSENNTAFVGDGVLEGSMDFEFNLKGLSDKGVRCNVEFCFHESNIYMNILVAYKPARLNFEIQHTHRLYTNLSDKYKRESIEYRLHSQEKYNDEIYYRFKPSQDTIDAYYDLVGDDFIDELFGYYYDVSKLFRTMIVKMFETRSR